VRCRVLICFALTVTLTACERQEAPLTASEIIAQLEQIDRLYKESLEAQANQASVEFECLDGAESPGYPGIEQVFEEARAAVNVGNNETALRKYVCVHIHAFGTPFNGVRGSFALSDWRELGAKYSPALAALKLFRDEAEKSVRATMPYSRDAFYDFLSINQRLDEVDRTVNLFRWLHANDGATAKRVFDLVSDDLIDLGEFELWVTYVANPAAKFDEIRQSYMREIADPQPAEMADLLVATAQHRFEWDTTKLVGGLAVNGLDSDARQVMSDALAVRDESAFRANLERALSGDIVEPEIVTCEFEC